MARRTVAASLSEIEQRIDNDPLLTPEVRAQIKEKAREHVAKKRRDAAEAKLLAQEIRNEEIAHNPLEQYEDVQIDLAPYVASAKFSSSYISLDGRMYVHGLVYSVPYSVARTLDDIMARAWEHENEIHGRRRRGDLVRKPMQPRLSPHDAGVPANVINTRSSVMSV
jgi:hypothetical protein